jgi:hypothetical protein
MTIAEAESANIMLRRIGVQSVYSRVYGTSGVVFTDLLNSVHELKPTSSEQEVRLFVTRMLLLYTIVELLSNLL